MNPGLAAASDELERSRRMPRMQTLVLKVKI